MSASTSPRFPRGVLAYDPDDIYVLRIDSVEHQMPVATSAALETNPQFSPDGAWLAYDSDEGGTRQLYVVAFPSLGGKRQISTAGERSRGGRQTDGNFFSGVTPL